LFVRTQRLAQCFTHEVSVAVQVDQGWFFHGARCFPGARPKRKRSREATLHSSARTNAGVCTNQPAVDTSFTQTVIAPSLLAGDFARLGEEARRVEAAGADWLHLDVMDGHFVDNISFGPAVVAAMHRAVHLPLDVHLMISRPDHYLSRFIDAGARSIHVHLEAKHDVSATLRSIRAAGCLAGLAINPGTSLSAARDYLPCIDLLLVMTVNPGFGGQEFITSTLDKVAEATKLREEQGWSYHIEVDGGIKEDTARLSRGKGANVMVAGTSVFHAGDAASAIRTLRDACDVQR
jgi:ribulose-phosphate 3-epimerase